MLQELRQPRYGYLLGLHILLLRAAGRTPTGIAAFLFCSRSSVYRTVKAYRSGAFNCRPLTNDGEPGRAPPGLDRPSLQRSLRSILKRVPSAFGWCRTRRSCAALALELRTRRGVKVSRETIRRWLHEMGYVWTRARHAAKDDDPERMTKLARIRHIFEQLRPSEVLLFADELDIHLLPKIGYEWMLRGTQTEVLLPGTNKKHDLAGALDLTTGKILHVCGERKNRSLFLDLLRLLERKFPAAKIGKIYVVADNYRIHKAQAVVEWLAHHQRFEVVWLPSYCPKANPSERAFGDIHDRCTRNHKRTQITDLVSDVVWHLKRNGPWQYKLPDLYYQPEVGAALAELISNQKLKAA